MPLLFYLQVSKKISFINISKDELQNCVKINSHTFEPVNQLGSYTFDQNIIKETNFKEMTTRLKHGRENLRICLVNEKSIYQFI
jgi:hypothetical protein